MSDQELLEAISLKDVSAFSHFYEKHNKQLFSKAYARVKDITMAEEIMQNFWIDIWEHSKKIKTNQDGDAKGFLSNFLLFRILDFLRKAKVNTIVLTDQETIENIENQMSYTHVSEEYDIKELETVINGILEEFPGKMAEIFALHYKEGYTLKETAHILQMNERTVKYKSKESVETLKKMLTKEGIDITSFRVARDISSSIVYIAFWADSMLP